MKIRQYDLTKLHHNDEQRHDVIVKLFPNVIQTYQNIT